MLHRQTNFDGSDPIDDTLQPVPLPAAFIDGGSDTTNYELSASQDLSSPFQLAAKTSLIVSAFSDDIVNNWKTIEATAQAQASIATFAFVEGAFGGQTGFVNFYWTVTGFSTVRMLDVENVEIETAQALTFLKSTVPGAFLISELLPYGGGTDFDQTRPTVATALNVPVAFEVGTEIPVFFDLETGVALTATNTNFGGFFSELSTDFFNTAESLGVKITDNNGQLIPGARLVSADGSLVFPVIPEPSSAVLGWAAALAWACSTRSRRRGAFTPEIIAARHA